MKKYLYLIFAIFSIFVFCTTASALQRSGVCTTSYRPTTNESAFAAVGSSLKISDKTCISNYLIIPFDTISGAVSIPQGEYESVQSFPDKVFFNVTNTQGDKVKSCVLCDPIKYLMVKKENSKSLCALTALNVETCAQESSISYTITKKSTVFEGLCTPTLVYFGRDGNTLRFAVNDCEVVSKPTLTYDLNLGKVIRFLDEEIEVIRADNQGIYYRRLETPALKNNEIISEIEASRLAQLKEDTPDEKTQEKTALADDKPQKTDNNDSGAVLELNPVDTQSLDADDSASSKQNETVTSSGSDNDQNSTTAE